MRTCILPSFSLAPNGQACVSRRAHSGSALLLAAAAPSAASTATSCPGTASSSDMRTSQPRLITYRITNSRSLTDLVAICQDEQQLNPIHVSAVLSACVKLRRNTCESSATRSDGRGSKVESALQQTAADHQILQELVLKALQCLEQQQHGCTGREIANVLWCLATLQIPPPEGTVERLLARFADVAHCSSSQAYAMLLHALAVLQHSVDAALLDHLLYSLIKAGRRDMLAHHQLPGQRQGSKLYAQVELRSKQCNKQQQVQNNSPTSIQAVANVIWAVARLGQPAVAQRWLLPLLLLLHSSILARQQQAKTLVHQQQQCDGVRIVQIVANAMWATATVLCKQLPAAAGRDARSHHSIGASATSPTRHQQRSRLVRAVRVISGSLLACCCDSLHVARPLELAMLMWAYGELQVPISNSTAARIWQASGDLAQFSLQECVAMLLAAAQLRLSPPPSWLAGLFAATQPQLYSLTGQQIASVVWACGTLRVRPPVGWMGAAMKGLTAQLHSSSEPSPAYLSMTIWGMSKLGYQPPQAIVRSVEAAVEARIEEYGPHQVSKLLFGCSRIHWQLPHELLSKLMQKFTSQLQQATPADITMTMRALAKMQHSALNLQQHLSLQLQSNHQQQQQWQRLTEKQQHSTHSLAARLRKQHALQQHTALFHSAGVVRDQLMALHTGAPSLGTGAAASMSSSGGLQTVHEQQALFRRVEQLLWTLSATELCQCLWASVVLGAQLPLEWSHAVNYTVPSQIQMLGPGDLCLLLWSLARLRNAVQVKRALHKQLLLRSQLLMLAGQFAPRDFSAFLWNYCGVFGSWRYGLPRSWLAVFCKAMCRSLSTFTPKQLAVTLRAFVLLDVVVDQQFIDQTGLRVELWSASLNRGELSTMSASLLQLQQRLIRAPEQSNAVPAWGMAWRKQDSDSSSCGAADTALPVWQQQQQQHSAAVTSDRAISARPRLWPAAPQPNGNSSNRIRRTGAAPQRFVPVCPPAARATAAATVPAAAAK